MKKSQVFWNMSKQCFIKSPKTQISENKGPKITLVVYCIAIIYIPPKSRLSLLSDLLWPSQIRGDHPTQHFPAWGLSASSGSLHTWWWSMESLQVTCYSLPLFPAAKMHLKTAKNTLNTFLMLFFHVSNCCSHHRNVIWSPRGGEVVHETICLLEVIYKVKKKLGICPLITSLLSMQRKTRWAFADFFCCLLSSPHTHHPNAHTNTRTNTHVHISTRYLS